MKKIALISLVILSQCVFSQDNKTPSSLNYIKIENYSSPSMNIVDINDFIKLIDDNNVKTVFFNDKLFLIHGPSMVYTINSNGYKNVYDLKAGNDKSFKNGDSYYIATENNLPDQGTVDYYRQEGFITSSDYHEATRLGFTHVEMNSTYGIAIYGLITKEDIQKNIKHLNTLYFLKTYKNWQAYEDQLARQNPTQSYSSYSERDRIAREEKEKEGLPFLENKDVDLIISKFGNQITKMKSFNYYLINIPLDPKKDSIFYYACKFCQYEDINDYKKNNLKLTDNRYGRELLTTKGTEQIFKRFSFNSIEAFLAADSANVTNGNDWNLIVDYGNITAAQLNQNRTLINELESIKQKYLKDIDLTKFNSIRYYSSQAEVKGILSFAIYTMLKMQKGVPVSTVNFVSNVQREYGNITIYDKINYNQYAIPLIFENIPQIKNMFVINNDLFYLK